MEYIISVIHKTRTHKGIALGVSPRGSLAFLRTVQAYTAIKGLQYVTPEFIRTIAPHVLAHRLILRTGFQKDTASRDIIQDILSEVPVPTEDFSGR